MFDWFRRRREAHAKVPVSVNARVRDHMGGDCPDRQLLRRTFPAYQIANISIMAQEFFDALEGAEVIGAPTLYDDEGLSAFFEEAWAWGTTFYGSERCPPKLEQIEISPGETRQGLSHGLVLVRHEDVPMLVYCHLNDAKYDPEYSISLVSTDTEGADRFLKEFLAYENEHSIFRGRLIQPKVDYSDKITEAEILAYTDVDWSRVVLPDELIERLQRDIVRYAQSSEALLANGMELKRGILFHGPPGTGKSFVCTMLVSALPGFTTILLTGDNLLRPSAAFKLARKLAPAVMLFEDIDLIGGDRATSHTPSVLGSLLNELDGLPSNEQVYFVFTTNHLDWLEEALAQRPGRVDLVLEFPLPTAKLRERLFRLYVKQAKLEVEDLTDFIEETDGVTPAFIRELMKQAVFAAIIEGGGNGDGVVTVRDAHLRTGLSRLRGRDDPATNRIVGFTVRPPAVNVSDS